MKNYYAVGKVGRYSVTKKGAVVTGFAFISAGSGLEREPYIFIGPKENKKAVINIHTDT